MIGGSQYQRGGRGGKPRKAMSRRKAKRLQKKGKLPSQPMSPTGAIARTGTTRVVKERGPGMVRAHGEPTRPLVRQKGGGIATNAGLGAARRLLGTGSGRTPRAQGAIQRKATVAKRRGRPKAKHFERFM